ncbi:MAG TPA: LysR family transcriptional regulator [Verrucomicrobiae bacterium]|nr:LysR family transcriptional regulator [Verrucomicrobiae bacterium]
MKAKYVRGKIQPRFRILHGRDIALGPGKAELLEQVGETGSIAKAAERMGMSYMRAWTLIKTMERCFKEPLIKVSRGGAKHGGAELTVNGKQVLTLYRGMERESLAITVRMRRQLMSRLRV